ncbi:MAG: insulinase family protein, partial [Pirellulales bacterium]|nr:insulinase family protein [Pirellulales bacterium]
VRLLADILRPSLREEDFQTEKQVIVEEIHMYEDQPPFGADETARALFFGSHPLGRSVLGTVESIEGLSVDAMRDYFNRRYSPENIALVGTGKIDFEALVDTVGQACGSWRPHSDAVTGAGREDGPFEGNEVFRVDRKEVSTQEYAIELSAGPAVADNDRFAAKLLATIIGDDSGSRFYWEMVDPGYAEQASLSHCEFDGAGVMMTYMSCDPADAADNLKRIHDIFAAIESDGVTAAELEQAKNKVRSRVVISSERPRGRLFPVGADWMGRREYNSMQKDLDDVAAITLDDLAAVVKKYPLTRCTTLSVGPLDDIAKPR